MNIDKRRGKNLTEEARPGFLKTKECISFLSDISDRLRIAHWRRALTHEAKLYATDIDGMLFLYRKCQ